MIHGQAAGSPWPPTGSGHQRHGALGAAAAGQPPQQAQLAIEQHADPRAVDLPAPRLCQIERTADLSGAAMRHVPESPWIAAMAAPTFGEIEDDAARRALDLISGLGAVRPKLRDDRAQSTNQ